MKLRISLAASLLLLVPLASLAQAADEPVTTLKIGTRLVSLTANVVRKGEPVRGLTKDDFTLKEDGKVQEIRYFAEGSDLPLTLALMVDTSGSQKNFIADETTASKIFFPEMLKAADDRAVLIQFDTNVLQLQKMTHSVEALEKGLEHLSEPHDSAIRRGSGGTLLYDAIVVTSRAIISKEPGRRAMVILTDGGDNGSRSSLAQAVAEALKADISIYSVYYAEEAQGFRGDYGHEVLVELSKDTGGEVFTVSKKLTLEQIYAHIAETMRLQYTLAYRPPESAPGTYHKIELKPTVKHLAVEAREGYYTKK